MDRRDPFYHQFQEVVTTEDIDLWLGIEEHSLIQEVIVQDYFDNLVDSHESEDHGTDVADIDSSPFVPLEKPLPLRSEVMSVLDRLENIAYDSQGNNSIIHLSRVRILFCEAFRNETQFPTRQLLIAEVMQRT